MTATSESGECVVYNYESRAFRPFSEGEDACDVSLFYSMEGQPLSYGEVISVDPFYKDCITDYRADELLWLAYNFEARSSFHGASGQDCDSNP